MKFRKKTTFLQSRYPKLHPEVIRKLRAFEVPSLRATPDCEIRISGASFLIYGPNMKIRPGMRAAKKCRKQCERQIIHNDRPLARNIGVTRQKLGVDGCFFLNLHIYCEGFSAGIERKEKCQVFWVRASETASRSEPEPIGRRRNDVTIRCRII